MSRNRWASTGAVLAGVGVLLLAAASSAIAGDADSPGAPGGTPAGVSQAQLNQDDAIDAFVQPVIQKYGESAQVSLDRAHSRILIASDAARLAELTQSFAGKDVGGFRVDVAPAMYSPEQYEDAARAIGIASFANHDLIQSYNLPADGSVIEISVKGLDSLDSSVRTSLQSAAENASHANVKLVQAEVFRDLAAR